MSNSTDIEVIKNSVLAQDLTAEEVERLSQVVKHATLAKDQLLFREGDSNKTLYVIISGKISVGKELNDGEEEWSNLHILKPGDITGEMSFIDGEPASLSLKAMSNEVELLTLNRDDFEPFIANEPMITFHVMRAILRTSHKIVRRMNSQYFEMNRFITGQYTANY